MIALYDLDENEITDLFLDTEKAVMAEVLVEKRSSQAH
jgi:hypothetical protein